MGRITGVSPAETRERLLRAAAAAFQSQGYEGTRVADIATGAGVSNGALYSHFGSKTELLAEALRAHGSTELASLFLDDPDRSVIDLLVTVGQGLIERSPDHGTLVVEALVAARRDAEVAEMMGGDLRRRDSWLAGLVREGQAEGTVDPDLAPEVVSRYCLMLLIGCAHRPHGSGAATEGNLMRVHVDQEICQGHGRCYSLAPELFEPDEIGNGVEIGDGTVRAGLEDAARKAVLNCPERAITIEEGA